MLVELSKMEQRYQAVMAVQVDGLTVTEVAEKFGVSRQTVHAGCAAMRQGGLDGVGGSVASAGVVSASDAGGGRGAGVRAAPAASRIGGRRGSRTSWVVRVSIRCRRRWGSIGRWSVTG